MPMSDPNKGGKAPNTGEGTVGGARPAARLHSSRNPILLHRDYTLMSLSHADAPWTLTSITAAHWSRSELHAVWWISGFKVSWSFSTTRKIILGQVIEWLIFLTSPIWVGLFGGFHLFPPFNINFFAHLRRFFSLNGPSRVSVLWGW